MLRLVLIEQWVVAGGSAGKVEPLVGPARELWRRARASRYLADLDDAEAAIERRPTARSGDRSRSRA